MKKAVARTAASFSVLALAMSPGVALADPVDDSESIDSQIAQSEQSLASVELELAQLSSTSTELEVKAAQAQADSIAAEADLSSAITRAIEAQQKANDARAEVEAARAQLGGVSQALYRDSASQITSSIYLFGAESFEEANLRDRAFNTVAQQADNRLWHFQAIEAVAVVLQDEADAIAAEQEEIARVAEDAAKQAEETAQAAEDQVAAAQNRRDELTQVLAEQRQTSIEEEARRLQEIEDERKARSEAAAQVVITQANLEREERAVEEAQSSERAAASEAAQADANLRQAQRDGDAARIAQAEEEARKAEQAKTERAAAKKAAEERAAAERAANERAEAERKAQEAANARAEKQAREQAAKKAAEEKAARERAAKQQRKAEEEARRKAAQEQAAREEAERKAAQEKAARDAAASSTSAKRNEIVAYARSFAGAPYVLYGNSPVTGWDCSGFVYYVFQNKGVNVPRATWQYPTAGFQQVPASQAQPGDVMWWPGHVGIYTGNGQHIAAWNPSMGTLEAAVWGDPVYYRVIK